MMEYAKGVLTGRGMLITTTLGELHSSVTDMHTRMSLREEFEKLPVPVLIPGEIGSLLRIGKRPYLYCLDKARQDTPFEPIDEVFDGLGPAVHVLVPGEEAHLYLDPDTCVFWRDGLSWRKPHTKKPGLCRSGRQGTEDENRRLRSRLAAAVKLKDWATHTPTCSKRRGFRYPPWDCDCGLDEALCIFEMTEKL